jgi:hypothetical protein
LGVRWFGFFLSKQSPANPNNPDRPVGAKGKSRIGGDPKKDKLRQ